MDLLASSERVMTSPLDVRRIRALLEMAERHYRYVVLDAYGRATSRDFDADVDVEGLFFGAGIRF